MGEILELDRRARERIGTTIRGKYHVDDVIGVGGMAVVFAATHRNRKRFALKMLHPELSLRDDVRARFLREGYVANSVGHPGAVAVLDDDVTEDGAAFLVMELLQGMTLAQLAERYGGRLPVQAVLAMAFQLLDVLAAAHAKGIVHRDIKPANVFVTIEGAVKVLDFGIARLLDVTAGQLVTGTGAALGTPAFMAPEQARGKPGQVDALSDVWAVGATMFALVSGTLVHEGESTNETIVNAATVAARSLAVASPGSPPALVEVVDAALAFEKTARTPGAAAMREAVARAHRALFQTSPQAASLAELVPAEQLVASLRSGALPSDPFAATQLRTTPSLVSVPAVSRVKPPPRRALFAVSALALLMLGGAGVAVRAYHGRHAAGATSAGGASGAASRGCASNAECVARFAGRPAICRRDDGACVALETEECKELFADPGDAENDATIWIGAVSANSPDALMRRRALDLARRDFSLMAHGVPSQRAGEPARPIAVVSCVEDLGAARAVTHLVDDLRVPAVIGLDRDKDAVDIATSTLIPRRVAAFITALGSSRVNLLPQPANEPRVVWAGNGLQATATAMAAAVPAAVEPELRRTHVLGASEPLRVAVVRVESPRWLDFGNALFSALRFNGKTAAENGESYRQVVIARGDAGFDFAGAAAEVVAFRPHVILGAGLSEIRSAVEAAWPAGQPRPRYLTLGVDPTVKDTSTGFRRRVLGIDVRASSPLNVKYALHYDDVFSPQIKPEDANATMYDMFYLLAFAAYAVGDGPVTGAALARQLQRFRAHGTPIEVGPSAIYPAFEALRRGDDLDVSCASGGRFDASTKEGFVDIDYAFYCLAAGDHGDAGGPPIVETGLYYDGRTRALQGSWRCP